MPRSPEPDRRDRADRRGARPARADGWRGRSSPAIAGSHRSVAIVVVVVIAVVWELAKCDRRRALAGLMGTRSTRPGTRRSESSSQRHEPAPRVGDRCGASSSRRPADSRAFARRRPDRRGALHLARSALIGFVLGAIFGIVLAILFVHSRLLERALVPYVIASQTVPIVALAPMVVLWVGRDWPSVA